MDFIKYIEASQNNDIQLILEFLETHNADYVDPIRNCKNTLLMYAAQSGSMNVAKTLVLNKADVNAVNEDGTTALIFACGSQQKAIVKFLVDLGADIKIQNKYKNTAMSVAIERENQKIINILDISVEEECFNLIRNHKIDIFENKIAYITDIRSVMLFAIRENSLLALQVLERHNHLPDKEAVDEAFSLNNEVIFDFCHYSYYGYSFPIEYYDPANN